MGIIDIRWHTYSIPLRSPLVTAHGTLASRDGAIIEIQTEGGKIGYGEIAPLPDFNGTTLEEVLNALQRSPLMRNLTGKQLARALHDLYAEADNLPASTVCGLESALLDALGQAQSRNISTLLARDGDRIYRKTRINAPTLPVRPHLHIPVNAVVGAPTLDGAVASARRAVSEGFRCIKLKVGRGAREDFERITEVRRAIGPEITLRLDANEGWDFETARTVLQRSAEQRIQYVEQPLPASNLDGMRDLRRAVSVPIAADEAVRDLATVRRVLNAEAADILILKPQLAGGLCLCRQIIREAAKYDVRCVITSAIETGIGVVGAVHLAAASPEVKMECGLATLSMLEDDLLHDELPLRNGTITVPILPGLGVQLDRMALRKYSDGNIV
jgi:o-succinylbenzoate synthase